MTIVITAFERSPDGGKGLARDTRVRWARDRTSPLREERARWLGLNEPVRGRRTGDRTSGRSD